MSGSSRCDEEGGRGYLRHVSRVSYDSTWWPASGLEKRKVRRGQIETREGWSLWSQCWRHGICANTGTSLYCSLIWVLSSSWFV